MASPSSIGAIRMRQRFFICCHAGAERAATPPGVMRRTDVETQNTLQESKTRVSSSGVDKSAYSAPEDPGSVTVGGLPLATWRIGGILPGRPVARSRGRCWLERRARTRPGVWPVLSQHHQTVGPVERSAILTSP